MPANEIIQNAQNILSRQESSLNQFIRALEDITRSGIGTSSERSLVFPPGSRHPINDLEYDISIPDSVLPDFDLARNNFTGYNRQLNALSAANDRISLSPLQELDISNTLSNLPEFTVATPFINVPNAPVFSTPEEPALPQIQEFTVQGAPEIDLPDLPVLDDVQFPTAPVLQIPQFTARLPDRPDLSLSEEEFNYAEENYENAVLNEITDLLLSDFQGITENRYGITPEDEEALYNRVKDRETNASLNQENELIDRFASRGMYYPPGTMTAFLNQNKQETQDRISDANREILVNRAELYRRGREFAVQSGISLNDLLLRNFQTRQQRLLQAAQLRIEFAIAVLNAKIGIYNADVQAYTQFIQAYQAEVQALLTQVEIYRTETDVATSKVNANAIQAQIYRTQIEAAQITAQIYETQVRGVLARVEVERAKIERFQSQVQAFIAQIEGQRSQASLYQTQVQGELAKVQVYNAQVDAFEAETRAASIRSEVELQRAQVVIANNENRIREFTARTEAYRAQLNSLLGLIEGQSGLTQNEVSIYEALSRARIAEATLANSAAEIALASLNSDLNRTVEINKFNFAKLEAETRVRIEAANTGARVFGAVMGAGQSSINALGVVSEEINSDS